MAICLLFSTVTSSPRRGRGGLPSLFLSHCEPEGRGGLPSLFLSHCETLKGRGSLPLISDKTHRLPALVMSG